MTTRTECHRTARVSDVCRSDRCQPDHGHPDEVAAADPSGCFHVAPPFGRDGHRATRDGHRATQAATIEDASAARTTRRAVSVSGSIKQPQPLGATRQEVPSGSGLGQPGRCPGVKGRALWSMVAPVGERSGHANPFAGLFYRLVEEPGEQVAAPSPSPPTERSPRIATTPNRPPLQRTRRRPGCGSAARRPLKSSMALWASRGWQGSQRTRPGCSCLLRRRRRRGDGFPAMQGVAAASVRWPTRRPLRPSRGTA